MIYIIKKDSCVKAIGDIDTLAQYVDMPHEQLKSLSREDLAQYVDCILDDDEWANYACRARIIDGQIFFGLTYDERKTNYFAQLRALRDNRLSGYDKKLSQLNRALYMAESEADKEKIKASIQAWHEYAQALCDLPSQRGAPWDGGGENTPWPEKPADAIDK